MPKSALARIGSSRPLSPLPQQQPEASTQETEISPFAAEPLEETQSPHDAQPPGDAQPPDAVSAESESPDAGKEPEETDPALAEMLEYVIREVLDETDALRE